MADKTYNFKAIEQKWQKEWETKKVFQVKEGKGKKFYVLEMYPYPSSSGLHMGHAFNYVLGDIYSRFKRMNGFNVLHPMGYDSFGLPAENAAIKEKSHPRKFTDQAIQNFIRQQKALGLSYDWSRILWSHNPEYYKWNQWFFIKMYEKGLAYRKKAPVNWCPKCQTVLANEQVHNGRCWRHGDTEVEIKNLEQWFLRITEYADEILKDTDNLDWPERIKAMQRNWIGRSEGAEIIFEIGDKRWKVFTTRADTLFGVAFLVVSAQHAELFSLVTEKQKKEVERFLSKIKTTKQEEIDKLEKEGVFTGSYAIHPLTKEKIPVYAGNFVLAEYGSGMVMAVPAHDQRDFEFAKKYKLPIKCVIEPTEPERFFDDKQKKWWEAKVNDILMGKESYADEGMLINSENFNGLYSEEAKEHIVKALAAKKLGQKKVQYKLRDWLISRQRYWGTPIPFLYDGEGNVIPVGEKDLPVKLPDDVSFGKGNPLATSKSFLNVKKDGKNYRRETDTMDTFFDSSWYFLRFADPQNKNTPFNKAKADYWMPVDFYTGGAEHACMHLIYARFFTKVLRDFGLVSKDLGEPFKRLFNQGMVHGEDGFVMSKSRGNVIDPMTMIDKYGADTLRVFLVSMSSPDSDFSWNSTGIETMHKFIKKIYDYTQNVKIGKSDARVQSKVNELIKEISKEIENLNYNLAVIKLRFLLDYLYGKEISKADLSSFIKVLAPFCPHVTEELWRKLGNKTFISLEKWPIADEKKINPEFEKEDKLVEDMINDVLNILNIVKGRGKEVSRLYLYTIPKEFDVYINNLDEISRRTGLNVKIFPVTDRNKHDPENKAKKTKPGKPGIYLE